MVAGLWFVLIQQSLCPNYVFQSSTLDSRKTLGSDWEQNHMEFLLLLVF